MYNPLENFKNPWDLDGEFAQSFLNLDKVLNVDSLSDDDNLEEEEETEIKPPKCPNLIGVYLPTKRAIDKMTSHETRPVDFSQIDIEKAIRFANEKLTLHKLDKFVQFKQVRAGTSLQYDGAIFLGADVADCLHLLSVTRGGGAYNDEDKARSTFQPFVFFNFLKKKANNDTEGKTFAYPSSLGLHRGDDGPNFEVSAVSYEDGGNIGVISLCGLYYNQNDLFNRNAHYGNLAFTLLHVIGHNSGISHLGGDSIANASTREDKGIMLAGNDLEKYLGKVISINKVMSDTTYGREEGSNKNFVEKVKEHFSKRSIIACDNSVRLIKN